MKKGQKIFNLSRRYVLSLVIFVFIVLGGLLLIIILNSAQNKAETTDNGSITYKTELISNQSVYLSGNDITFVLTNNRTETINLRENVLNILDRDANVVYKPSSSDSEVLASKGTKQWIWNQKNSAGELVAPGIYTATINTSLVNDYFQTRFYILPATSIGSQNDKKASLLISLSTGSAIGDLILDKGQGNYQSGLKDFLTAKSLVVPANNIANLLQIAELSTTGFCTQPWKFDGTLNQSIYKESASSLNNVVVYSLAGQAEYKLKQNDSCITGDSEKVTVSESGALVISATKAYFDNSFTAKTGTLILDQKLPEQTISIQ